MKVALEFKEFGVSLVNTEDRTGTGSLISGYNLFAVSDILDECGVDIDDIQSAGMLISGGITYYCDFDINDECDPYPKFQWVREDIDENSVSSGFNFRKTYYSRNSELVIDRLLVKYHGIRFRFSIQGYGGKFQLGAFSSTLGSGIALTAIAAVITELFLRYCISERSFYTKRRMEVVSLKEEEEWVRKNSSPEADSSPKSSNQNFEIELTTQEKDDNPKTSNRGRVVKFL